ncbi:MAG: SMC-Scp complex subunit ScpB [Planctomycetota bacterium]|jgi:segregation and condensation protein B
MSLAEDSAEADVPTGDEESGAGESAGSGAAPEESGGIDLSKFVPDTDETADETGDANDAPDDTPDDAADDVSDEELEKVVPLIADGADGSETDEPDGASEDNVEDGDADAAKGARRGKKSAAPVDLHLRAAVEAVIFAADDPVTPGQVAKAIGAKPGIVKRAILEIQERLDSTGSGLLLQELGGGFTFTTHAEHAPAIRALRKTSQGRKLSPAAIDTLAIVAYKQPVQRQEIEDIRGVASCGPMLRQLMQLDLAKIVGRAEVLGKPLLYGTTKRFLDMFGLADIKDLPKVSELEPR